jgi:hypothetical protein
MKIPFRSLTAAAVLSLVLAACTTVTARQIESPSEIKQEQSALDAAEEPSIDNLPDKEPTSSDDDLQPLLDETSNSVESAIWPDEQVRIDQQGAVEIAMLPVNLNYPADTLDFEVSLNTHSVDLSMDLAALAWLRTDSGVEVKASAWTGPSGGHHVSGILSFPSAINGEEVLDGAAVIELRVLNVDAPERVFVWER